MSSNSTPAAAAPSRSLRSSSRRNTSSSSANSTTTQTKQRWTDVVYAAPPWGRHYKDIGHCRFAKCTLRIQQASDKDIDKLPKSHLADAIAASSAYNNKKQEGLLVDYAQALLSRGIDPNDQTQWGKSAVACAAYYGYTTLLEVLLLQGKCRIDRSHPHALRSAVENGQHGSIRLLLEHRQEEVSGILREEERSCSRDKYIRGHNAENTLDTAIQKRDSVSVQLLRDMAHVKLSDRSYWVTHTKEKWSSILQDLYSSSSNINVHHWSRQLHWSFPSGDRHVLNWIWYHVVPATNLSPEIWLHVFSFIARGWWMLPSHKEKRRSFLDVQQWNVIP